MKSLWNASEDANLRFFAMSGFNGRQIAERVGRPYSGTLCRAKKIGVSLPRNISRRFTPTAAPPAWDDADRICAFANVPLPLAQLVVETCRERGVDLKTLRAARGPNALVAIRHGIAIEARKQGYSYPLIGRALNRDHTTIIHAVRVGEALAA